MRAAAAGLLAACAGPYGQGPRVYDEPVPHDGDEWLFTADRVNRLDLEVDADAERILRAQRMVDESREEVPARAVIDGEPAGVVGLRLGGGSGSFLPWDDKPKLRLDFRWRDDDRFHGLERLALDNAKMDCGALGQALAAEAFAAAGVPASRTGWAQVFVNGADYGLYVVVEVQDDRFLERAFGDEDARLYDGSYRWAGWLPYFLDFGLGRDHRYDLEEGDDVGFRDLAAVSGAVEASLAAGRVTGGLPGLVDWDLVHRFVAVDQWLGVEDSYPTNRNNVSVVFPTDGPMALAPWDLDTAFREEDERQWTEPRGRLWAACARDPACRRRHGDVVRDVLADLSTVDWGEELELRADRIEVGVEGDPRRRCSDEALQDRRRRVRGWFDDADARVRSAWP